MREALIQTELDGNRSQFRIFSVHMDSYFWNLMAFLLILLFLHFHLRKKGCLTSHGTLKISVLALIAFRFLELAPTYWDLLHFDGDILEVWHFTSHRLLKKAVLTCVTALDLQATITNRNLLRLCHLVLILNWNLLLT